MIILEWYFGHGGVNYQECTIEMPISSEILAVGYQNNDIVLWTKTQTPVGGLQKRTFVVVGTDVQFDDLGLGYIGTATIEGWTWHVFER